MWILSGVDLQGVWAALRSANPLGLLCLGLFFPLGTLLTASRWRLLLRSQGHDFGIGYLFGSIMVALFVRQLLPTTVGGDLVRAYDSWRGGAGKLTAVTTLVVERLLGVLMLACGAILGLALSTELRAENPSLSVVLVAGASAIVAVLALVFAQPHGMMATLQGLSARVGSIAFFDRALASIAGFRGRYAVLAGALGISALMMVQTVVFYYLIGWTLDLPVRLATFFLIVPLALFVMLAPISINGIGLREGIFVLLLGRYGVPPDSALAFAWMEYGLFLLFGLLGGIVYVLRRRGPRVGGPADSMPVSEIPRRNGGS